MEALHTNSWPVGVRDVTKMSAGSAEEYFNQTSQLPEFASASKDAVKGRLQNRTVREDPELWQADQDIRIQAMQSFNAGYLPLEETTRFTTSLVSSYVYSMRCRDVRCPRYRRYFYSLHEALRDGNPLPSRSSLDTLTGINFSLTGLSGMGRTAYLQRLRTMFGPAFRVVTNDSDVKVVWFIPMLVLQWPECGTLKGFLQAFRDALVSEVKDPASRTRVFGKMKGKTLAASIISACLLLNVGMVAIDGAVAASLKPQTRDILMFLNALQGHTNIPVLLSRSEAFEYGAAMLGKEVHQSLRGRELRFQAFSSPSAGAGNRGLWHQFNTWLWRGPGLLPPTASMPEGLPEWTYSVMQGRPGWLVEGFRQLHEQLIWEPQLLCEGRLTGEYVMTFLERRLGSARVERDLVRNFQNSSVRLTPQLMKAHVDCLPLEFVLDRDLVSLPRLAIAA